VKISQFITLLQYSLIALLFFGDGVFSALGIAPPALYLQARENKAWSCFLLFMIGNQITAQLLTTGAFEVYTGNIAAHCLVDNRLVCTTMANSQLIFSKLSSHRMPEMGELLDAIAAVTTTQ